MVDTVETLSSYGESGHRQLLGLPADEIVAVDEVLSLFGKKKGRARQKYLAFIADGADQGKRSDLVGGGLRRSLDGVLPVSSDVDEKRMVSDERVLGEGDFVEAVLNGAER